MTHDKQKLEYLLSQLKAGMTIIGNNEDTAEFALIDNSIVIVKDNSGGVPFWTSINLDATAAANGIEWPTGYKPLTTNEYLNSILPHTPRMFTEQEVEEYTIYNNIQRESSNSVLGISAWLKSKEEKLMLGDCEYKIEGNKISFINDQNICWTVSGVTPEDRAKFIVALSEVL